MVPELTELTFYYMNLVTVARVQRNPTVKSEIQMRNFEASIPVGFFCYPISQAADITAFRATHVPVGEDQMPMIEQCKEIVHKFNTVYGETLTDPKIVLPSNKACLRLPGIDGKAKMSKSLGNCIYLSDEEADVKKKPFEPPRFLKDAAREIQKKSVKVLNTAAKNINKVAGDLNAAVNSKKIEDQEYSCLTLLFYMQGLNDFLGFSEETL